MRKLNVDGSILGGHFHKGVLWVARTEVDWFKQNPYWRRVALIPHLEEPVHVNLGPGLVAVTDGDRYFSVTCFDFRVVYSPEHGLGIMDLSSVPEAADEEDREEEWLYFKANDHPDDSGILPIRLSPPVRKKVPPTYWWGVDVMNYGTENLVALDYNDATVVGLAPEASAGGNKERTHYGQVIRTIVGDKCYDGAFPPVVGPYSRAAAVRTSHRSFFTYDRGSRDLKVFELGKGEIVRRVLLSPDGLTVGVLCEQSAYAFDLDS